MSDGPAASKHLEWKKNPEFADFAEQTLQAIRQGAVDAFVVQEPEGHRVYTLQGADLPYSVLVEQMQQGAAMLNSQGEIIYCNPSLAQLLGTNREDVIGAPLRDFVDSSDLHNYETLRSGSLLGRQEGELCLRCCGGTTVPASFAFSLLSRDMSAIGVLITDLTAYHQRMELSRRLQQLQDEERRRIARELHDSVGQLLAAVSMNITRVSGEVTKLSPEVARLVPENAAMIEQINNEIRTISHLLHPPLLDEVGLPSAIRWLVDGFGERSNIQATVEISADFPRLPQDVEIAIFRAVQECLSNVHRHSGSPSCTVQLSYEGDQVRVEIKDRGRGIPATKLPNLASTGGVGLRGMEERFRQLGGKLEISSGDDGTSIIAVLPVSAEFPNKEVA